METTSAQTRRSGSFDSDGLAASARDDKREAADGVRNDGRCRTASAQDDTCAPAVAFEHVTKRFGDAVAVNDVDLAIEEGAFVAIIGSSGCGKTTLLKMVNALVMPDEGEVLVHGQATSSVDPIELRRTVGYAIQGSVLFPHLSVEQNIAYVPTLLNKRDRRRTEAAVEKWMDIIGLPRDIMDRYPAELSGGQAQRVGIARALAASPDILLVDEPFSAVDAITRSSLQDEIKRIHRQTGITVLFVTHDIDEALDLGDKVLVMEAGHAVQFAPPCEILRSPATEFVDRLVSRKQSVYAR
ncbi:MULTISPECIES: ATP-binding cassette domain-containing protein [Gordonibacter]|uniref:ATP-binding cassette domain-containing protein n=1 Tax=Gordonibacter TaxID=644652 RepID=UPI0026243137|nr:ABC transporter ATP-binding protein [Gordonibacter sp. RACS_AR49]MDN4508773.1 ABC transporter ATP-binding protein [Gordonibacter sp. RACS_AR49]